MKLQKNIVLIGMPGSGKTTIAKAISRSKGLEVYDIDEYIEKKEGKSITDIFKSGEEHFRKIETEAVKEISSKEAVIISTGGGVVKSPYNMELLKKNGLIVFINRSVEAIIKDVNISNRPLLKEGKSRLYELYAERYELYKSYCDYEIVNDKGLQDTVKKILDIIR